MKTQNQNKYPTRTVTGVVTFDQDYSGVFIRCDHDEHVAKMLELVLDGSTDLFARAMVERHIELLKSANNKRK